MSVESVIDSLRPVSAFQAFFDALIWRPIAELDREDPSTVLFRNGKQWAIGYFGQRSIYFYADGTTDFDPVEIPEDASDEVRSLLEASNKESTGIPDVSPLFRHAQDSIEGVPLDFAPTEFADIDDNWRGRLMAD